jgi:phage RecT family recombinase
MSELTPQQNRKPALSKDPVQYLKQFKESFEAMIPEEAPYFKFDLLLDQLSYHMTQNDKLRQCSPDSLGKAIKNCCLTGLLPGYGADTAEVYFIPYNGEASADISYKGLETTLMRTGMFRRMRCEPLWEGDHFEQWDGSEGAGFSYKPGGSKEILTGAFAMAETIDGVVYVCHMTGGEIEDLEKKTRKGGKQTPAWRDWPDRMARKTVIKRLCKNMPRTGMHPLIDKVNIIDMENAEIAKPRSPNQLLEGMK